MNLGDFGFLAGAVEDQILNVLEEAGGDTPSRKQKGGFCETLKGLVCLVVIIAITFGIIVAAGVLGGDSSSEAVDPDFVPTPAPTVVQPVVCSFDIDPGLNLLGDGSLTMKNYINLVDRIVSVQLDYNAEAWLGFAFTELAQMVPNKAIIGLPDDDTVQKYQLQNRTLAGVNNPLEAYRQSLISTSIGQENGHTIMQFSKKLIEIGEIAVKSVGANRFNWAVGADNTLGIHRFKGSESIKFNSCHGNEATLQIDDTDPSETPNSSPTNHDRS